MRIIVEPTWPGYIVSVEGERGSRAVKRIDDVTAYIYEALGMEQCDDCGTYSDTTVLEVDNALRCLKCRRARADDAPEHCPVCQGRGRVSEDEQCQQCRGTGSGA